MIGWDSHVESSRAVREALDMIIAAETVHIVLLVDRRNGEIDHGDEPGSDLGRHTLRGTAPILSWIDWAPENRSTSEVLQQHAIAMSADLLVLGAMVIRGCASYLFGGVTQSMLDNPPMPILMAR